MPPKDDWKRAVLPDHSVARLRDLAGRQGTPGHLFSSDLSVPELSLVRQAGYEPLGQVMGSSIYHVGYQWNRASWQTYSASYELDVLTEAFYNARHLAIGRLRREAALLRATAIVGVRLTRESPDWAEGPLEFMAIGTAIREADAPPPSEGAIDPVATNLSGQDFWTLRQAGFRPLGLVVGNCSYYQIATWRTRQATQSFWSSMVNQELTDYTAALYTARDLAQTRMAGEARALGAAGVVEVSFELDAEPREVEVNKNKRLDMLYHCTVIGTAIAEGARPPAATPIPIVPLT